MPVLSEADRVALWAQFMDDNADPIGALTKVQLRAAGDALDQFLSDNASAINSAIPQPARAVLTAPQKARLLMVVIERRYLTGV